MDALGLDGCHVDPDGVVRCDVSAPFLNDPTGGFGSGRPRYQPLQDDGPNRGGGGFLNKLKSKVCSIIPDGRTVGFASSAGTLGGVTGGGEIVLNYNTGQVSGFGYAGGFAGFNGGGSASVTGGLIFNLGNSNSNYSGPFTTAAGSVGLIGGFASVTGTPNSLNLSAPKVLGASVGITMFGVGTGTVSVTKYSNPRDLGNFANGTAPAGEVDYLLYLVRRVCK